VLSTILQFSGKCECVHADEQKLLLHKLVSRYVAALFTYPVPGALWSQSWGITSDIPLILTSTAWQRWQMCITKVCHLLPVFIWFSEVFAVLVYVALRSFVVSKQIILPCEPRYPNSKDTGGKTISSHRGMCFTSQQSASKLGVVCLNFIKTLSSVGNSLESLRSFCCHLFLASLSLPSQPYSEQGLAACWRLCRLCRTLLPCPKAVFWH